MFEYTDYTSRSEPKSYKMNPRVRYNVLIENDDTSESANSTNIHDASAANTNHSIGLIAQDITQIENELQSTILLHSLVTLADPSISSKYQL